MVERAKAKSRRPTSFELRKRVVAAINEFIAGCERREWVTSFSSTQFHVAIDDEYRVSIGMRASPTSASFLFSVPLGLLGLDPWAVELGGGVRDAALDIAAQSVLQKFERSKWWVP
jgi:hypothetical protein